MYPERRVTYSGGHLRVVVYMIGRLSHRGPDSSGYNLIFAGVFPYPAELFYAVMYEL